MAMIPDGDAVDEFAHHVKDVETLIGLGLTVERIVALWRGMPGATLQRVKAEAERLFMKQGASETSLSVRRQASFGLQLMKELPPTEERLHQLVARIREDFNSPPQKFVCPVSLELMSDPVLISSGHAFDRSSLYDTDGDFRFDRCPFTRQHLEFRVGFPIVSLRCEIVEYKISRLDGVLAVVERVLQVPSAPPSTVGECSEMLDLASSFLDSLGAGVYRHRAARLYRAKLSCSTSDADARLDTLSDMIKYTSRTTGDKEFDALLHDEVKRARGVFAERWAADPRGAAKFAARLMHIVGGIQSEAQTLEWIALLHDLHERQLRTTQAGGGDGEGTAIAPAAPAAAPEAPEHAAVKLTVKLTAANRYGFSATSERGAQLINAAREGPRGYFLLTTNGDECSLESMHHRGFYVCASSSMRTHYGQRLYTGVLSAPASGEEPPKLRKVEAVAGVGEPYFSLELPHAPGYLLCHCDGLIWFMHRDRPLNSAFPEDASWSLHDIAANRSAPYPASADAAPAFDAPGVEAPPIQMVLTSLAPPTAKVYAAAYWKLMLAACVATPCLWRQAYTSLIAAGAAEPAAAIDAMVALADGSGVWLEAAGKMLLDLAHDAEAVPPGLPPFIADAPSYLRPPFGDERAVLIGRLAEASLRVSKEKGRGGPLFVASARGGVLGAMFRRGLGAEHLRAFLVAEGLAENEASPIVEALPVMPARAANGVVAPPPAWLARLIDCAAAAESQTFQHDCSASEPELFAQLYPQIRTHEAASLSVRDGVLVKTAPRGQEGHADELYGGMGRVSSVTYQINITCDSHRYNVGLGCYIGDFASRPELVAGRVSAKCVRLCFHPGMRGGQFRIEPMTCNRDIGFTPPDWGDLSANPPGQRGTKFTIQLSVTGDHSVTLEHPTDPSLTYTEAFTLTSLWTAEMARSPSFGIYAGDIRSRGTMYYEAFSAASSD